MVRKMTKLIYATLSILFIVVSYCFANHTSTASSQPYPTVDDGNKMIVISALPYKNALGPFIHWKNRKGIQTTLYEYPSETGGNDVGALETFIQQRYDEDTITYILLVGDAEDIPTIPAAGGDSDPSFTLLAGSDVYHDAFIGRFSVETEEQALVMANKVLQYEMDPDPDGEWYNKACGIASSDGSPKNWELMDMFRDTLLANGFSEMDQIYDSGATAASVTAAVNRGRGWIHYLGHGSVTMWGTTGFGPASVDLLENTHMLPIILAFAPNNGVFPEKTCLAEAWTRCGTPEEGRGALAFFGFSLSYSWPIPPVDGWKELIYNLTQQKYYSLGAIFSNGMARELDQGPDADYLKTWILFGDPSLMVYTKSPTPLECVHPETISGGTQKLSVSGEDSTRVCVYSKGNDIHQTAEIKNGSVDFTFNVTTHDSIYVTGIMQNRIPYLGCILPDSTTPVHFTDKLKGLSSQAALTVIPNPGRGTVHFRYDDQRKDNKQLEIFTLDGRLIYTTNQSWVKQSFTWDCKTNEGNLTPPGLYCAVLQIKHTTHVERLKTYFCVVR